ncbi:hypothetical protein ABZ719_36930 [Streptomyces sp. NPDC006743]|uniref:hypothetical protein n=1 Tax=Streptomyces sp. NPDC006743 TaxID=3154480 RepID=UPI003456A67E
MDDSDEERIRRAVERGVRDAKSPSCTCGGCLFILILILGFLAFVQNLTSTSGK